MKKSIPILLTNRHLCILLPLTCYLTGFEKGKYLCPETRYVQQDHNDRTSIVSPYEVQPFLRDTMWSKFIHEKVQEVLETNEVL